MGRVLNIKTDSGKQINEDLGSSRFINLIITDSPFASPIPHNKLLSKNQLEIVLPDEDMN